MAKKRKIEYRKTTGTQQRAARRAAGRVVEPGFKPMVIGSNAQKRARAKSAAAERALQIADAKVTARRAQQ